MRAAVGVMLASAAFVSACSQIKEASDPRPPENPICRMMRQEFVEMAKSAALDDALASTEPEQGAENNHLVRVTNTLVRRQTLFNQMQQIECDPAPYLPVDAFAREALACKIAMKSKDRKSDDPLDACRVAKWREPTS
jgi:hypothetical protein